MEKNRVQKLTLVLCVVLLGLNLWQGKRLAELERRIFDAQMNMMRDIKDLESSLYIQAQEAERLVQRWSYSPSLNREKRCLDVEISAVLKEWSEETAAELLWYGENDDGEGSVPLSGDGTGTFTGSLEIALDEVGRDIGLALVTQNGGGQRREELGLLGSVSELLPVQCNFGSTWAAAEYLQGVFSVYECGAELHHVNYSSLPETEGHVFRLRRNGDVAAEQAAEPGDRSNSYFCGRLYTEAQPGDQMALTFFCRDENGLGYEFLLQNWVAVEERDVAQGSSDWTDWPRLTWD